MDNHSIETPALPAPAIRHDGWTADRQLAFVDALAHCGNVAEACRMLGMGTTSVYRARRRIPGFAAAWDAALKRSTLDLERIATERALDGYDIVVRGPDGEVLRTTRKANDRLLMFLLKAARPEKYGAPVGKARVGTGHGAGGGAEAGDAIPYPGKWPNKELPWYAGAPGNYWHSPGVAFDGTIGEAERLLNRTMEERAAINALYESMKAILAALGWEDSIMSFAEGWDHCLLRAMGKLEESRAQTFQEGMFSAWYDTTRGEAEKQRYAERLRAAGKDPTAFLEAEAEAAHRRDLARRGLPGASMLAYYD
jgi:hypothetical protein